MPAITMPDISTNMGNGLSLRRAEPTNVSEGNSKAEKRGKTRWRDARNYTEPIK